MSPSCGLACLCSVCFGADGLPHLSQTWVSAVAPLTSPDHEVTIRTLCFSNLTPHASHAALD